MLARYVGQHGEGKRTAVAARYFVGLARAMPAGARHHGRTKRQGMPRRGGLSGISEAADDDSFSARLLRHRSVRGWTMGGGSAPGNEEASRGMQGRWPPGGGAG